MPEKFRQPAGISTIDTNLSVLAPSSAQFHSTLKTSLFTQSTLHGHRMLELTFWFFSAMSFHFNPYVRLILLTYVTRFLLAALHF
jgi:hypothetical protein